MKIKQLKKKLADAQAKCEGITTLADTEKRSMTDAEVTDFDNILSEVRTLERQIKVAEQTVLDTPAEVATQKSSDTDFRNYLQKGETRALVEGTDASGGYTVPEDFSTTLFKELDKKSSMLEASKSMDTSSDILNYPTIDDIGNEAQVLAEGDTITDVEPTFGNVQISIETYGSTIALTNQLLHDNKTNLESVMSELLANRLSLTINRLATAKMIDGAGDGGTADANTPTIDEIYDLVASVEAKYQNSAVFMMNNKTFWNIRKIKDSNGRPLIQDPLAGEQSTLLGKKVFINDDLANDGKSIIYGDLKNSFLVARNWNTTILRDPYSLATKLETQFIASVRYGYASLSETKTAYKALTLPSS